MGNPKAEQTELFHDFGPTALVTPSEWGDTSASIRIDGFAPCMDTEEAIALRDTLTEAIRLARIAEAAQP